MSPSPTRSRSDRFAIALMLIGLVLVALALPSDAMARLLGLAGVRPVGGSPLTSVPKDGVLVLSVTVCQGGGCSEASNTVNRLRIELQASSSAHACPAATTCYLVAYVLYRNSMLYSSGSNSLFISSTSSTPAVFMFGGFSQSAYTNVSVTIVLARST